MSECPSHLVLAGFHTDDLSETRHEEIARHLSGCQECQHALASLKQNADAYDQQLPRHQQALSQALAAEVNASTSKQKPGHVIPLFGAPRFRWVVPMAAAAVVLIVALASTTLMQSPEPSPTVAYKGEFSIRAVARRHSNQFAVDADTPLQENDAVRFTIQTSQAGYLLIGNLDSRGQFTVLYPDADASTGQEAFHISTPGRHTLPDSVVLDDAPGKEYFLTIFSPTSFKTDIINSDMAKTLVESNKSVGGSPSMLPDELPAPLQDARIHLLTVQKQ